jgi:hypothetical protein
MRLADDSMRGRGPASRMPRARCDSPSVGAARIGAGGRRGFVQRVPMQKEVFGLGTKIEVAQDGRVRPTAIGREVVPLLNSRASRRRSVSPRASWCSWDTGDAEQAEARRLRGDGRGRSYTVTAGRSARREQPRRRRDQRTTRADRRNASGDRLVDGKGNRAVRAVAPGCAVAAHECAEIRR